jgi:hypothetical protein
MICVGFNSVYCSSKTARRTRLSCKVPGVAIPLSPVNWSGSRLVLGYAFELPKVLGIGAGMDGANGQESPRPRQKAATKAAAPIEPNFGTASSSWPPKGSHGQSSSLNSASGKQPSIGFSPP